MGGSASFASYASSFFCKPGIVSVVGEDFPDKYRKMIRARNIDLEGLKTVEGKTFRWAGSWDFETGQLTTTNIELNSLEFFEPVLPENYKKASFVFLGNMNPTIQLNVINQLDNREKTVVISDTMNYWIEKNRKKVLEVVKNSDAIVINHKEARKLFATTNWVGAVQKIVSLYPKLFVIKRGEHGATLFAKDSCFSIPAYPLNKVIDPTGTGDCFGGCFTGYLAKKKKLTERNIRNAVVYASVLASFKAQAFSFKLLQHLTKQDIEKRFSEFKQMVKF